MSTVTVYSSLDIMAHLIYFTIFLNSVHTTRDASCSCYKTDRLLCKFVKKNPCSQRKHMFVCLFVCLLAWCLTALSAQTRYRAIANHVQGQETTQTHNKTMKQYSRPRKSCALFGLGFLETIPRHG